jgi:hypothetical protein
LTDWQALRISERVSYKLTHNNQSPFPPTHQYGKDSRFPILRSDDGLLVRLAHCFSLPQNYARLMAPPRDGPFLCLDAVRVLSMLMILLGHTMFFETNTVGVTNPREAMGFYGRGFLSTGVGLIANSCLYGVDTFLALAGFLAVLLFMKELGKVRARPKRKKKQFFLGGGGTTNVYNPLSFNTSIYPSIHSFDKRERHTHIHTQTHTNTHTQPTAPPPHRRPSAARVPRHADGLWLLHPPVPAADARVRRHPGGVHDAGAASELRAALAHGPVPRDWHLRAQVVAKPVVRQQPPEVRVEVEMK